MASRRSQNSGAEVVASAPPIPTLAEVVAQGYELRAAHGIVASAEALAAGMSEDDAAQMRAEAVKDFDARQMASVNETEQKQEPKTLLEIQSVNESFWRAGKKFTRTPTKIDPAVFSEQQLNDIMRDAGRKLLIVKSVAA